MSSIFEDEDAPGLPGPSGVTPYLIHWTDTFTGTLYDRSAGAPPGPPNDERDIVGVQLEPGYGYIFRALDDTGAVSDSLTTYLRVVGALNGNNPLTFNTRVVEKHLWSVTENPVYVVVSALGQADDTLIGYTLVVEREIGADTGTATTLALGETLSSRIDTPGDSDWIRVDLTAGHGYVFDIAFHDTSAESHDWRIRLQGIDYVARNTLEFDQEGIRFEYVPTEDETFWLDVSNRWNYVGNYTLSYWQEEPGGAGDAQSSNAGRYLGATLSSDILSVADPVEATVDLYADVDSFRVETVQNAVYRVTVQYPEVADGIDVFTADVFDDAGAFVVRVRTDIPGFTPGGLPSTLELEFISPIDGPLFLSVRVQADALLDQDYTLSLSRVAHEGTAGNDLIEGSVLGDTLRGDDGVDTLIGGDGDDFLFGGDSENDLRDVIYAGDGNDSLDGGWGNDELHGGNGNDTVMGNFGSDTLIGNAGDDVIAGGPGSDAVFGGPGNDTVNGGWGFDRLNGGDGADRFYHAGAAGHASDWIQDYDAAQGDVLVFGTLSATLDEFQVNMANTPGAGNADVAEAFVVHRPTGQILWALVDGEGQDAINILLNGQIFDLLA